MVMPTDLQALIDACRGGALDAEIVVRGRIAISDQVATTRKGKACQRTPLPGREYCPSHSHLEEPSTLPARVGAAA